MGRLFRIRKPRVGVDVVILKGGRVVLVRRGNPPFRGRFALPGGFLEPGETVEQGARREAREETRLRIVLTGMVGVYSEPGRDPRGPVVTIAFRARPVSGTLRGGDDAAEAKWFPAERPPPLAFDHRKILRDALRGRGR